MCLTFRPMRSVGHQLSTALSSSGQRPPPLRSTDKDWNEDWYGSDLCGLTRFLVHLTTHLSLFMIKLVVYLLITTYHLC